MNFLNAFIFTFIYGKCFAKTCDSNAGFWSCKDGTATFQEDLFIEVKLLTLILASKITSNFWSYLNFIKIDN